jgi:hypothetical protein
MRVTLPAIALLAHCTAAWGQYLPPEEFDRPYDGRIVIQEAGDDNEVRRLCPQFMFGVAALGCAYQIPGVKLCAIVKISDEKIRAAGYDPEIFMRHERGHCLGWGADHKGAR